MARVFTFSSTVALIAGLVLAQWLAVLPLLLPVAPTPVLDCSQHRCCCPVEVTARKACCCFGGAGPTSGDPMTTLIRAAQCSGDSTSTPAALAKMSWLLELPAVVPAVAALPVSSPLLVVSVPCRVVEPAVPPPKSFLEV